MVSAAYCMYHLFLLPLFLLYFFLNKKYNYIYVIILVFFTILALYLFSYPPFSYLVRIYNGEKTFEESRLAAIGLYDHLQTLTKTRHDITISNPLPFSPSFAKGQHWHGIVIKISFEKYKQLTKFIAENIPENWKFDPNPNNLLSF